MARYCPKAAIQFGSSSRRSLTPARAEAAAEAEARGPAGHARTRLADSLALRLLRRARARPAARARSRSGGLGDALAPRPPSLLCGGNSGTAAPRGTRLRASYERAVELDSSFALAYWRLGAVRDWQNGSVDSLSRAYYRLAGERNHGLPPARAC